MTKLQEFLQASPSDNCKDRSVTLQTITKWVNECIENTVGKNKHVAEKMLSTDEVQEPIPEYV